MNSEPVKKQYINNKDLYDAIVQYKKQVKYNETVNKEKPIIPNYIGECIWKIAANFAHKHSYKNYPFKEDMISDAVENCLRYLENFNEHKYNNPHAYFSQITQFAFHRRIEKEKTLLYTKFKIMENIYIGQDISDQNQKNSSDFDSVNDNQSDLFGYSEGARENMYDFITVYEKNKEKKKLKKMKVNKDE